MGLYSNLRLYISRDAYHLVPESQQGDRDPVKTLVVERNSGELSVRDGSAPPKQHDQVIQVYGVFGIVSLLNSDYLIVITDRRRAGSIFGSDVYRATDFKVFPISPSPSSKLLRAPERVAHPNETFLLALIKAHLTSGSFYYGYDEGDVASGNGYDVTTRLQAQVPSSVNGPVQRRPLWERADDRFFWNRYLQSRLIDLTKGGHQDASKFILPVMFGFLELRPATINGQSLLFGLISRRNRHRAGTRYFSRGVDSEGNVSNFNETEQIVVTGKKANQQFSYVQTRGSVPIYWAEISTLRYKPDLLIMDVQHTAESLGKHLETQVALYGDQYLVNLVNTSGYEKPVKEAYERAVEALAHPKVHYTYFDFHHECKGLRFDRVQGLIDRLRDDLYQQSYFAHDAGSSPAPQRLQRSVVRTNCMDCLDRTNVVQSALGKFVLNEQLRQTGVLGEKEAIDDHKEFIFLFRNVWADNADAVSTAYSGTGALKTDFTRTGKRSKEGALQDLKNSLVRYVKNNFFDGSRQDAYDLVTGTWVPRKGKDTPFIDRRPLLVRIVPFLLLISVVVLAFTLSAPSTASRFYTPSSTANLILLSLAVSSIFFIVSHGVDYVAYPRLNPFTDTIGYEGKGYRSGRHGLGWALTKGQAAPVSAKRHRNTESEIEADQKKRVD